jgi:hypothetical protein
MSGRVSRTAIRGCHHCWVLGLSPEPRSDSRTKSGLRKIRCKVSLDFAKVDWTRERLSLPFESCDGPAVWPHDRNLCLDGSPSGRPDIGCEFVGGSERSCWHERAGGPGFRMRHAANEALSTRQRWKSSSAQTSAPFKRVTSRWIEVRAAELQHLGGKTEVPAGRDPSGTRSARQLCQADEQHYQQIHCRNISQQLRRRFPILTLPEMMMYSRSPGSPWANTMCPSGKSTGRNCLVSAATALGWTPWKIPALLRISSTGGPHKLVSRMTSLSRRALTEQIYSRLAIARACREWLEVARHAGLREWHVATALTRRAA